MPLTTQEFDLEETLEAKKTERDNVVEKAAKLDDDNPGLSPLIQDGNRLDTHIRALEWAVEKWDADAITLAGMTGGECAQMENELEKDGNGSGDARVATIVHGTEDAPYLVTDEDGGLDKPKTYYQVGQLPFHIQSWIEDEVNEMTSPGNLDATFGELLQEARHNQDGTESSESNGSS